MTIETDEKEAITLDLPAEELEHFELVTKNGMVHRTLDAADIRAAAVILDRSIGRKWRRDYRLRQALANCMVIDIKKKEFGEEYIDPKDWPDDVIPIRFQNVAGMKNINGKIVPYLIREDGVLKPYKRPEEIEVTPQKVYRATKIKDVIILWFVLRANKNTKLIVGMLVALIIGMLLLFYVAAFGK